MPFPLIPVIAAGASLLGNALNNEATSSANKESREWQEHMYDRQRQDALEDWQRNNVYNSPSEQMERLKRAGLNPNLVYGSGSAVSASSPVRSSSTGSYRAEPMRFDVASIIPAMMQLIFTMANTANKQADTANKETKTEGQDITNYFNSSTLFERKQNIIDRNAMLETQQYTELRRQAKLEADIAYTIASQVRQDMLAGQSVQESVARIRKLNNESDLSVSKKLQVDQQLKLLLQDEKLKQYELNLNDSFLGKGDPAKIGLAIFQSILGRFKK